jgi:hypothetical protein
VHGCHTDPLELLIHGQEIIMGTLEDLQAADTHLGAAVAALAEEQVTFLQDVAARLADAPDPAAVKTVVDDIEAKSAALAALAQAQRDADPAGQASGANPGTQDPAQIDRTSAPVDGSEPA